MIFLNDTIKTVTDLNHFRTKYKCNCDKCGLDRGYLSKQNAIKPFCRKCVTRSNEESKKKMSNAKLGKIPWNKGKKEQREEVIDKLSSAKIGKVPYNKGQKVSFETKMKLSCISRKIKLSEFDELQTPIAKAERNKFAELGLHKQCFENSGFKCQCCSIDKVILNAHHLNSWKFFPEERFTLSNLVSLCKSCHDEFHKLYGNGKASANTKEQFELFKIYKSRPVVRKKIIVVAGTSGSGKSWVCNQLNLTYIRHDKVNREHIRSIMFNTDATIMIYDPTVHVSSFIKRNKDIFDIDLFVIQEVEKVI